MGRLAKQLFIGSIFLIIVGGLVYAVYDYATPDATCSDNRQNQGEEGVDCGTVCGVLCGAALEPLVVGNPQGFGGGESFDVLVEMENNNAIYGAVRIDYRLLIADSSGVEKSSRRGFTYVNPLETRYLVTVIPGEFAVDDRVEIEYDASKIQWFQGRLPASSVVDFSVLNEKLVTNEDGSVSITADVRNDSTFDFDEVDVSVILFDASNFRIGVGSTIIRTLVAGQIRAFTVEWPDLGLREKPVRAQVEVTTNVFDNANFIRTYGGQERFQGF